MSNNNIDLKTKAGIGQPMPLTDLQEYNKTLNNIKHTAENIKSLLKTAFWWFALPFWILVLGLLTIVVFILWQIMYYDVLTHAIRFYKGQDENCSLCNYIDNNVFISAAESIQMADSCRRCIVCNPYNNKIFILEESI